MGWPRLAEGIFWYKLFNEIELPCYSNCGFVLQNEIGWFRLCQNPLICFYGSAKNHLALGFWVGWLVGFNTKPQLKVTVIGWTRWTRTVKGGWLWIEDNQSRFEDFTLPDPNLVQTRLSSIVSQPKKLFLLLLLMLYLFLFVLLFLLLLLFLFLFLLSFLSLLSLLLALT